MVTRGEEARKETMGGTKWRKDGFSVARREVYCTGSNQGGVLEVGEGAVVVLPVADMAQCLGDQVLVADHHPLGRACGARGEGEDGRVAGWLDLWR